MSADRAMRVTAAIERAAGAEGVPVTLRHVCLACATATGASGVALSAVSDLGLGEPLSATDPRAEQVMETQVTLGEGPSVEVLANGRPVLMPDLANRASHRRWPAFAPAAVECGTLAVFAFPLVLGAISVGVLEIHRAAAGSLSAEDLADALLFSDAATLRVLQHLDGSRGASIPLHDGVEYRWAEVHQATGVVSVQLDTSLGDALLRLRAHAYFTGRRLSDVAHAVLAGELHLQPGNADQADENDEQNQG